MSTVHVHYQYMLMTSHGTGLANWYQCNWWLRRFVGATTPNWSAPVMGNELAAQTIYGHALLSASTVLCPSVLPSRGYSGIHHDLVLGISVGSLHHHFHNHHGHWATIFRVHISPHWSLRGLVILIEVAPSCGASRGETPLRTIFEIKKLVTWIACHTFKYRHLDIH